MALAATATSNIPVTETTSRDAVKARSDDEVVVHKNAVDPAVSQAVAEFVKLDASGIRTDIEVTAYPYDAIEEVSAKLKEIGVTHIRRMHIINKLIDDIEMQGMSFTKMHKAKPLYIRIRVSEDALRAEDLPEGVDQYSISPMEGVQDHSNGATGVGVRATVHGTKTTVSNFDFGSLYDGPKTMWIALGTLDIDGLGEIANETDLSIAEMVQAFTSEDGGGLAELKEMIENDQLTPEALELIETMAELKQLVADNALNGAVPDANEKITDLLQTIDDLVQSGDIPQIVVDNTISALVNMHAEGQIPAAVVIPSALAETMMAHVDVANTALISQIEAIIEQAEALGITPENTEVLQAIVQQISDGTPITPEMIQDLGSIAASIESAPVAQQIEAIASVLTINSSETGPSSPTVSVNNVESITSRADSTPASPASVIASATPAAATVTPAASTPTTAAPASTPATATPVSQAPQTPSPVASTPTAPATPSVTPIAQAPVTPAATAPTAQVSTPQAPQAATPNQTSVTPTAAPAVTANAAVNVPVQQPSAPSNPVQNQQPQTNTGQPKIDTPQVVKPAEPAKPQPQNFKNQFAQPTKIQPLMATEKPIQVPPISTKHHAETRVSGAEIIAFDRDAGGPEIAVNTSADNDNSVGEVTNHAANEMTDPVMETPETNVAIDVSNEADEPIVTHVNPPEIEPDIAGEHGPTVVKFEEKPEVAQKFDKCAGCAGNCGACGALANITAELKPFMN